MDKMDRKRDIKKNKKGSNGVVEPNRLSSDYLLHSDREYLNFYFRGVIRNG